MTERNKLMTAGSHPLDEATSALQKCIRRGLEFEALYWAQELESRYWRYLWKRLLIISHEDIGIANPGVQTYVWNAWQLYQELRAANDSGFCLVTANVVMLMCRSPKSRIADHIVTAVYYNADLRLEVPDFALDMHTKRGRAMGRGVDHFYAEGAVISNAVDELESKYKDLALQVDANPKKRPWLEYATVKNKKTQGKVQSNAETSFEEPENYSGDEQLGLF